MKHLIEVREIRNNCAVPVLSLPVQQATFIYMLFDAAFLAARFAPE